MVTTTDSAETLFKRTDLMGHATRTFDERA